MPKDRPPPTVVVSRDEREALLRQLSLLAEIAADNLAHRLRRREHDVAGLELRAVQSALAVIGDLQAGCTLTSAAEDLRALLLPAIVELDFDLECVTPDDDAAYVAELVEQRVACAAVLARLAPEEHG